MTRYSIKGPRAVLATFRRAPKPRARSALDAAAVILYVDGNVGSRGQITCYSEAGLGPRGGKLHRSRLIAPLAASSRQHVILVSVKRPNAGSSTLYCSGFSDNESLPTVVGLLIIIS